MGNSKIKEEEDVKQGLWLIMDPHGFSTSGEVVV